MADAGPDGLMSAPPGTPQDAGSDSTIAATVEAAKAIGMAHVMEIEQSTHTACDSIGDLMPLPPPPDIDTTVLGGLPVAYVPPGPPKQGGY
jgi:hypothetical protein